MKVVYNSFGGRYSDNPRAIHEELLRHDTGHRHVWLVDERHRHGFPPGTATVPFGGAESVAALESADVVVSNTHIELEWTKKPGATYLQTWHGTPLKHIHFDTLSARPERLAELTRDVRRWDHLISPNATSTANLRQAFGFAGEITETGYPRNDLLAGPGAGEIRARVRAELGITEDQKVVLYTPTWRDDLRDENGRPDFRLHLDLDTFTERLGQDHVLLLRLHYMLAGRLGPVSSPGVRDVSFHPEIGELYLAADVMVTDYSSTMFDFAITGKPLLFYTYDLAHYRDTLRGFYFDFQLAAPGPLVHTGEQLCDALLDLDAVGLKYGQAYARFRSRFAHLEDGQAAERVVRRYFPAGGRRPEALGGAMGMGTAVSPAAAP